MRFFVLSLLIPCFFITEAARAETADTLAATHADSIGAAYSSRLDSLAQAHKRSEAQASSSVRSTKLNPYFYRMLLPGTLYNDAVSSNLRLRWQPGAGAELPSPLPASRHIYELMERSSASLAEMYVSRPGLVDHTDADIQSQDKLRQEVTQPIGAADNLGKMAVPTDLGNDMAEPVAVKAHRPNFWKFYGDGSLHFQQNYSSENWHSGQNDNYTAHTVIHLDTHYDNQRKFTWHNHLDFELGFQTSEDKVHKLRVTNNLLRLTSAVSYQAIKNWSYTGEVKFTTQSLRNYNWESYTYSTGFLDPLDIDISVGMKYNYKSKKGKVWGELYLAPLAYSMRYVASDSIDLRRRHGIEDGHSTKHSFGPNAHWHLYWKIAKNVMWTSKMDVFSNFHMTRYYWENTFEFTINKYLSSKFFFHPRFDDSSEKYRSKKKDTYWMFQEWLSLGLTYRF